MHKGTLTDVARPDTTTFEGEYKGKKVSESFVHKSFLVRIEWYQEQVNKLYGVTNESNNTTTKL